MSEIDRVAPSRRPERTNDGTQRWRDLLFLHWRVSARELRALVPAGLELDDHEGTLYVGAVPFVMQETRAWWMPRFAGLDFLETNLRTYVRYRGRPGVYFFSLEAASWLAVKVARSVWKLPYFHASMQMAHDGDDVRYETRRRDASAAGMRVRYRVSEPLGPSRPGSLEHFLLERYLLFSMRGDALLEGQVHHRPYPAHRADVLELEESLLEAAGLPAPGRGPDLMHFSPGVDVEVFGPWPARP